MIGLCHFCVDSWSCTLAGRITIQFPIARAVIGITNGWENWVLCECGGEDSRETAVILAV
jgi:hypothetical protein